VVTLDDLFDRGLLDEMLAGGYVREQAHPDLPLSILNYTEKAQYERVWNPVTRTCRGLIVDSRTGVVVARPFPKFFNHGEPESAELDLAGRVVVTDKADGSLGIAYPTPGGRSIATRGAFASEQAVHATMLLRDRYPHWKPLEGCTALFEIVYPANRIVVDYGQMDDLILLGYVHIDTGRSIAPEDGWGWPGPVIDTFEYGTFADALAAKPRPGKEGLVVHLLDSDQRIKLKQADYIRLHRIVTGLNARTVWEHLRNGGTVTDLIEPLPDEFHQWVKDVANDLRSKAQDIQFEVDDAYRRVLRSLPDGWSRKDYALMVKDHPHRALLFKALDGADYRPLVWRQLDPGPDWRPTTYTDEAA
jgi:RNA ligase